jgi:hypothetical protein
MNTVFILIDAISITARLEGKVIVKKGTILRTDKIELAKAQEYYQYIWNLRAHPTEANLGRMPQSEFGNPNSDCPEGYGLDENGLLIKGGQFEFESIGRILNTKKAKVTPKKEAK